MRLSLRAELTAIRRCFSRHAVTPAAPVDYAAIYAFQPGLWHYERADCDAAAISTPRFAVHFAAADISGGALRHYCLRCRRAMLITRLFRRCRADADAIFAVAIIIFAAAATRRLRRHRELAICCAITPSAMCAPLIARFMAYYVRHAAFSVICRHFSDIIIMPLRHF